MAPSSKKVVAAANRRKSSTVADSTANNGTASTGSVDHGHAGGKHIVTLKVESKKLRNIVDANGAAEAEAAKDAKEKASPATSTTLAAAPNSTAENGSDSNPNTPATGTPAPQAGAMGPPTEGPKKKGTKRGAGAMNNGEPKVRGKPGPKKKIRLEDGTVEGGGGRGSGLAAHKLGPRANQGAINAGLRALDRSGKPCRKWTKTGFTLKSFTGVVWEISRWSAPPRVKPTEASAEQSASVSAEDSSRENKENGSQVKSDNGADVDMQSAPTSVAANNSPVPVAIAAA